MLVPNANRSYLDLTRLLCLSILSSRFLSFKFVLSKPVSKTIEDALRARSSFDQSKASSLA